MSQGESYFSVAADGGYFADTAQYYLQPSYQGFKCETASHIEFKLWSYIIQIKGVFHVEALVELKSGYICMAGL